MAGYASYEDYTDLFLLGRTPAISQSDFPFWSQRASSQIDAVTFARLKDAETLAANQEAVILCCCELAEYMNVVDERKGLSSISVTGHSMSFDKKQERADTEEIVRRYLGGTGLLYSGVY